MALIVRFEPSFDAKHAGFPFQVAAVEAVKDLEYSAVFHEQGLGKTKIAIDLALTWLSAKEIDSVIIVTKKGLIDNWKRELAVHSYLRPRILGQDRRANHESFNSPARVYLAHYEVMRSEASRITLFTKTRRVAVILDEAHKIKNPTAVLTQALFRIGPGCKRRVIMTGTPVANRPYDLWAQIYFLDRGTALGPDFDAFRRDLDLRNDLHENVDRAAAFENALGGVFDRIRPFTVRETKATSGIVLPEKHIEDVFVDLRGQQEQLYRQYRDELSAVVVREGRPLRDDADEMLKRMGRLVQVASNPGIIDDEYDEEPSKFTILQQLLEPIMADGRKAIVWTTYTANADWLAKKLARFGAVRVHGKRSIEDRNAAVNKFKSDPSCRIFVATPASSKEGLTLTVANHVFFYDRSFSLDDYLQAQDRVHRISQTEECYITNLIARDTVDAWVDRLLAAKHLAAKLGQGDITPAEYLAHADYTYGAMIRDVLGVMDDNDEQ